jgi:hypothetical protein
MVVDANQSNWRAERTAPDDEKAFVSVGENVMRIGTGKYQLDAIQRMFGE